MENTDKNIPETTLEALVRSFFKESSKYGFKQVDYVRFVNMLLDFAMKPTDEERENEIQEKSEKTNIKPQVSESVSLPIKGNRIQIRAYKPSKDETLFEKWLADDFGRHFLLSRTTAVTMKIDQLLRNDANIVGVVTLLDGKPIGAVAFLDFDSVQRKAELRKLIGEPDMRGKGFGKEATRLWIAYGKNALGLKKIYLNTLNTNIHNIQLNEELGFKVEGILRNEVFVDGEYRDVLRMALWKE